MIKKYGALLILFNHPVCTLYKLINFTAYVFVEKKQLIIPKQERDNVVGKNYLQMSDQTCNQN